MGSVNYGHVGARTGVRGDARIAAACNLLGLPGEYTADDIKTAFRTKARDGHPDNGGNADMDALTQAKELLLTSLTIPQKEVSAGRVGPCGFCSGRGKYWAGKFEMVECPACHGTGER